MNITVVGLGKIGLPLAVQFARKGHNVFGSDVNENTVEQVNSGIEPFPGEAKLQEYLNEVIKNKKLNATTDTTSAVSNSDAVVVVVPLYVDENGVPDFGWMDAATEAIGKGLKKGTLVSYETTLPVGTTRNHFAKALIAFSSSFPQDSSSASSELIYSVAIFEKSNLAASSNSSIASILSSIISGDKSSIL